MRASVIFSGVCLLALAGCVCLGWRRHWVKTALSLAVAALAFAGAFFLASGLISLWGASLSDALKEALAALLDLKTGGPGRQAYTLSLCGFAASALLGLGSFLLFFALLWALGSAVKRALFRRITGKTYRAWSAPHPCRPLSLAGTLASLLIASFALLYPLGTAADVATCAAETCETALPAFLLTHPVLRLYGKAGRPLFDRLAQTGRDVRGSDEGELAVRIYLALERVGQGQDADGQSIVILTDALRESDLMTGLVSELAANAAASWHDGQTYLHMLPAFPQGRAGELIRDVLGIVSGWQRENLIQDMDTAIHLAKLLQAHQILKMTDAPAFLEALSQEDFTRELFETLSQNEDMIAVIPKVLRFGISSTVDSLGLTMNEQYIVEFDASALTQEEWQREAQAFSTLLRRASEMSRTDSVSDPVGFLSDLYALRDSKLLNNLLTNILIQIFQNLQTGA